MENQSKTVTVGEQEYVIQKFLADEGARIFVRLMKIVAPPLAKSTGLQGLASDSNEFADVLGDIVGTLLGGISEDEAIKTIESLLSVAFVNGQPLADPRAPSRSTWKVHFQGQTGAMFLVLSEVIKENYQDFFVVLKPALAKFQAQVGAKKTSGPAT